MRIALLTIAAVLALASPAAASQVAFDGQTLAYTAGPGEANNPLLSVATGDFTCGGVAPPCLTIYDGGAHIATGTSGCVLTSSTSYGGDEVACPLPQRVRADLGDGDDSYWDWDGPSTIDAGGGSDNPIYGGGGDDAIDGGPGNDLLFGDAGDDTVDGGPGDDALEGIPGAGLEPPHTGGSDTYSGGGGGDSLVYTGRTEDLALSNDGVANDGAAGERDDIGADVKALYGGTGNDTLTGSPTRDVLVGDTGDDKVTGGGGDDALYGSSGNDTVEGGAGQDYLEGDGGDDVLTGGPDTDAFYGESPLDYDSGRDQIFARDGLSERVACGPGIDSAQADLTDVLLNIPALQDMCENVDAPTLRVVGVGAGKKGAIVVRLHVPQAGAARVDATAKKVVVGHASGTARGAGPLRLSLRPSGAARRALARRGRLVVALRVTFAPAGGGGAVVAGTWSVTLRARR
jgi:hypothetical protein